MRKKIKNSLSAKVFLWVFSALTICSMFIYGIVMTVLPERYQLAYDRELESKTEQFFSELEQMAYTEAVEQIYNFCIQNNSTAVLSGEQVSVTFGEMVSDSVNTVTENLGGSVIFTDSDAEYILIICSISNTPAQISSIFLKLIPVVLTIILLLSAASAFICSKIIVAPIAEISEISKRMTMLDFTWSCDVASDDEIGVLASSLNTMANRLETTMNELESANRQLTADVKKFQSLEEQRRNFFSAVSHELKTPLTILKGQIENMMLGYGDYQNHEKYLPELFKTTENIEYLVQEILSISKMESMNLTDTLQDISLLGAVRHTIDVLSTIADEKEISIHQDIEEDVTISVNRNLWDKVLSNIIGNAIRHSTCGENVYISCENGKTLRILNTGVTIPDDDLPNMFTPFYRTDKSRSRATGGSGLGLYIVKTILDLHGMTYCIRNTQNGVAFEIDFNCS